MVNTNHDEVVPEAGDVVVKDLCALLLLEEVRGKEAELHDHVRQSERSGFDI